jgi:hypothetical protein
MMYAYPSHPFNGPPQYTARPHAGETALLFPSSDQPVPSPLPVRVFVQKADVRAVAHFLIDNNYPDQPFREPMKTFYTFPPGATGYAISTDHPCPVVR